MAAPFQYPLRNYPHVIRIHRGTYYKEVRCAFHTRHGEIAVRKARVEVDPWHGDKILGTLTFVRPLDDLCIQTHDALSKGDISYPRLAPKQYHFDSLPQLDDLRKTLIHEIIRKEENKLDDGDSDGISRFKAPKGADETTMLLQNITNPS
jgi:hypothetical protein